MYQYVCSRYGYAEWIAEIGHRSMALFAIKHANITLPYQCKAKRGLLFVCLSYNVVASFKSKTFFPQPQLPHPPKVDCL